MDAEQTFIRVQERFSQILTPKVRAALEYIYLFIAITLFFILVVMHANYVQQEKPNANTSGVERKTPSTVGAGELPTFGLKTNPERNVVAPCASLVKQLRKA